MKRELTEEESRVLTTPFRLLSSEERMLAFLVSDRIAEENRKEPYSGNIGIMIQDKDALLRDGVKSPCDGKTYGTRQEWNDHLKRNNLVEFGNEKIRKREIQVSNLNLKPAIAEAIKKVRGS